MHEGLFANQSIGFAASDVTASCCNKRTICKKMATVRVRKICGLCSMLRTCVFDFYGQPSFDFSSEGNPTRFSSLCNISRLGTRNSPTDSIEGDS